MNVYFLAAGGLLILLALAHATWGEGQVFNRFSLAPDLKMSVYVPWHQMTYVLFVCGVALLLAPGDSALPYFILALVAGNFAVFVAVCVLKKQTHLFSQSLPQMALFFVLINLLVLGMSA